MMLMPIVLLETPRGNEWRGTIKPEIEGRRLGRVVRQLPRHAAPFRDRSPRRPASTCYVVGSELVSTESHSAEWTKTIHMVRSIFHGMLTYSSNWDHYVDMPFWDQLDMIGMNSYWEMAKKGSPASVDEIVSRWREIQKDLMAFSNRKGKPILLVEVGWCSMANAAYEPWDYTQTGRAVGSGAPAAALRRRSSSAWYGNPNLGGFMIWEWEPRRRRPRQPRLHAEGQAGREESCGSGWRRGRGK